MSPKQRLAWRTPKSVINEWHLDTYGHGITERPDPTPDWKETEALQVRKLDDITQDIEVSEQTSAIDQLTQIVSLAFPEENETIALPFNPTTVDIQRAGRETSEPLSSTPTGEDSDSESGNPTPYIGLLTPEATPPPNEDGQSRSNSDIIGFRCPANVDDFITTGR
ncbi:hypothetical protein E4U60_001576 [Claviceps pazoutovae]|uniref:Uncharacterized protein n=1 Tax=Claviceps pazoutovae TaxID=1649127 RepID=A0A9P7MCN2_9HYPO|nr:hypothetical protein E4U60_001576 [Claviceps pazoutovae]